MYVREEVKGNNGLVQFGNRQSGYFEVVFRKYGMEIFFTTVDLIYHEHVKKNHIDPYHTGIILFIFIS